MQEPYMIAKLDSAERTYKELSVSEIILLLIIYIHFNVYSLEVDILVIFFSMRCMM